MGFLTLCSSHFQYFFCVSDANSREHNLFVLFGYIFGYLYGDVNIFFLIMTPSSSQQCPIVAENFLYGKICLQS